MPLPAPLMSPVQGCSEVVPYVLSAQLRGGLAASQIVCLFAPAEAGGGMTPNAYAAIPPCRSSSDPATVSGFVAASTRDDY